MATSRALAASGIVQDPSSSGRIIPESRRADGSIRKERKVKPGFVPTEDVARYRPPGGRSTETRRAIPGSSSSSASSSSAPGASSSFLSSSSAATAHTVDSEARPPSKYTGKTFAEYEAESKGARSTMRPTREHASSAPFWRSNGKSSAASTADPYPTSKSSSDSNAQSGRDQWPSLGSASKPPAATAAAASRGLFGKAAASTTSSGGSWRDRSTALSTRASAAEERGGKSVPDAWDDDNDAGETRASSSAMASGAGKRRTDDDETVDALASRLGGLGVGSGKMDSKDS